MSKEQDGSSTPTKYWATQRYLHTAQTPKTTINVNNKTPLQLAISNISHIQIRHTGFSALPQLTKLIR
jgi:hypothetical protein